MREQAIILANGMYRTPYAKVAHGLVRGPSRYEIVGVVDSACAGQDAGSLLDGDLRNIGIFESIDLCLSSLNTKPKWVVVGAAIPGGGLEIALKKDLLHAIERGLSVVSGLHQMLNSDDDLKKAARLHGVSLLDIRTAKPIAQLSYWSGKILEKGIPPRVAVLGTNCGEGKRTTAQLLRTALCNRGVRAEFVYTGQTGWLQGGEFGFILDATPNDFVSGELEKAVLTCAKTRNPELIIIEGQSSLRNPAGPCGAELIVSCNADGVVLQHAPGRHHYIGFEHLDHKKASIRQEVELIRLYGVDVWAIAINPEGLTPAESAAARIDISNSTNLPVLNPLDDHAEELSKVVEMKCRPAA